MGLRDLTTEAMVGVTSAWVDSARDRARLAALPRVAPLLTDVDAAHAGLVSFQVAPKRSPQAQALIDRAAELDALHDRKARGIHGLLAACALLADDLERADIFTSALTELFPDGLSIVHRTYLEQAGQAELLEQRLGASTRELLEGFTVGRSTLRAETDAWIAAARQLGEVKAEKARLDAEAPVPTTTITAARNAWIGTVNAVLHMIELETEASPEVRAAILRPLEQALDKATAARKRGAAKESTETEPEAD